MKNCSATRFKASALVAATLLVVEPEVGSCGTSMALSCGGQHCEAGAISDSRSHPTFDLVSRPRLCSSVVTVQSSRTTIGDRLKAVRNLGNDLSKAEIKSLYSFLTSPPRADESNLPGLNALKSDLLAALEGQISTPPGLADVMMKMYRNSAQDPVTRDYALQHMAIWYETGAAHEPADQEQIRNTLEGAVQENNSAAGTALLGLHRLFQPGESIQPRMIDGYALRMATSSNTDPNARITAVQVCAERRIMGALPTVEALVRDPGPTALRISAISALGRLGGPEQASLLRQLESEPDKSLRPVIVAALRQLEPTVASRNPF